jgi:hypothetical protein
VGESVKAKFFLSGPNSHVQDLQLARWVEDNFWFPPTHQTLPQLLGHTFSVWIPVFQQNTRAHAHDSWRRPYRYSHPRLAFFLFLFIQEGHFFIAHRSEQEYLWPLQPDLLCKNHPLHCLSAWFQQRCMMIFTPLRTTVFVSTVFVSMAMMLISFCGKIHVLWD